ncbi:MAG: Rrf2 family transcriptional regulator [Candidatus Hydrogenedentes bacterium]|nr:Rrf2 family transcriptional regulator [Candidatus Hydrogenedentota bacterium]
MFKLYSKGCQHALWALSYAHLEREGARFQPKDVCHRTGIPEPFTRKILQALVQGGFLNAHRGPGGGYTLARSAEKISLLDVIKAVEGRDTFDHCVMGLPECGGVNPCPIHRMWADAKTKLLKDLAAKSLADIAVIALKQQAASGKRAERKRKPSKRAVPRSRGVLLRP